MKYRIIIQWHNPPTPTELTMLNCHGDREGANRKYLLKQATEIMKSMRNVARCSVEPHQLHATNT